MSKSNLLKGKFTTKEEIITGFFLGLLTGPVLYFFKATMYFCGLVFAAELTFVVLTPVMIPVITTIYNYLAIAVLKKKIWKSNYYFGFKFFCTLTIVGFSSLILQCQFPLWFTATLTITGINTLINYYQKEKNLFADNYPATLFVVAFLITGFIELLSFKYPLKRDEYLSILWTWRTLSAVELISLCSLPIILWHRHNQPASSLLKETNPE